MNCSRFNVKELKCPKLTYNGRSEVVSALTGGVAANYAYGAVGNRLVSTNRPNGRVANLYRSGCDGLDRRVYKSVDLPSEERHEFYYNGWNPVVEKITPSGGTTATVRYVWGKDLSGNLQGAGGVGGLFATQVGGAWYFPAYDANGNITQYVDEDGHVVASYTYDAFGNTVAESGAMASVFPFRFSTKYYDSESGLYYYGYRFYSPRLGRWLTRDPIEESGGVNLYGFCGNDVVGKVDVLGFWTWTEDSAKAYLEGTISVWRDTGWNFAADALAHYLKKTKDNADLSKHSDVISKNNNCRNVFMRSVSSKLRYGEPEKQIGDTAHRSSFTVDLKSRSFIKDPPFALMFNYRFHFAIDGGDLFMAMYGSRFSYVGTASKKRKRYENPIGEFPCYDEITINLDVATWDQLTYPAVFGRDKFRAYSAAMFLEANGYKMENYIYLRWNESGTWRSHHHQQGLQYWEKVQ